MFTDTSGAHCFPVLWICASIFVCFPFSLCIRILEVPPEIIARSILTMAPKGTRLVSWFFLHPWKCRLPQCAFYSTRSISTSFRLLASRNFPKAGQLSIHDSANLVALSVCSRSQPHATPNLPSPVSMSLSMG